MKVLGILLVAAAIALLSLALAAQENLPDSYLQKLATIDRLQKLTSTDLAYLTSHAQSGAPEAQYQLALVYGAGRIVPRDIATMRRWMLKSAEQGYVPAETGMGEGYLANQLTGPVPNYAGADRWLRMGATDGDAEAQFWLGIGYDRGYFGGLDYQESLKWLRMSAAQGLPNAQLSLGQMHEEGHGVPDNDEVAAYWYRKAADHFSDVDGVFEAEVQLAYMYRDGRLKRDNVQAYMWFAVLDSSLNPPTDEDVQRVAKRMTNIEVAEAQRRAKVWIDRHPRRPH